MIHIHAEMDINLYWNVYIHKPINVLVKINCLYISNHTTIHTKKISKYTLTHANRKKPLVNQKPLQHTYKQTPTHIHTRHIKYQKKIRGKADQGKHTLKKVRGHPYIIPLTNWKPFKLQTRMKLSFSDYPITKALCYICSLTKATN